MHFITTAAILSSLLLGCTAQTTTTSNTRTTLTTVRTSTVPTFTTYRGPPTYVNPTSGAPTTSRAPGTPCMVTDPVGPNGCRYIMYCDSYRGYRQDGLIQYPAQADSFKDCARLAGQHRAAAFDFDASMTRYSPSCIMWGSNGQVDRTNPSQLSSAPGAYVGVASGCY